MKREEFIKSSVLTAAGIPFLLNTNLLDQFISSGQEIKETENAGDLNAATVAC